MQLDVPTDLNPLRRAATLARWAALVLLVAMFVGTHLPFQGNHQIAQHDKMIHFWSYMTLSFMVAASWDLSIGGLRSVHYLIVCFAGGLYGAFDELTQPLVGRVCDEVDWLYDVTGIVAGLALFRILRPLVYRVALMMARRVGAS